MSNACRIIFPILRGIITHRFPVSEIQQAFELFWQGETGKVVIEQ